MKKIVVNPNIRFGKPCIKGTRIAVHDVLNLLSSGYAIEDIPKQYPQITIADVRSAIKFAAKLTQEPKKIASQVIAHA